jgi:plastocyanin
MAVQLRKLFFLCLSLFYTSVLFADSFVVNAGGYYYSPSNLTIASGDTVYWYNDGGFHNVNAEINSITGQSFDNPESFVSGATNTVGALIYMHVFNAPGVYNYDCSIGSHAANGMVGSINVMYQNPQEPTPVNPVEVTFRVNMQDQEVNPTGVFMAGGPWQVSNNSDLGYTAAGLGGGTPPGFLMNDDDGDDIWELTLTLEEGSSFYWKFRNGYYNNFSAVEGAWEVNFAGQGCGYWDNGDRQLIVPSQESSYDFCFNSCDSQCPLPPVAAVFSVNVANFPDPVQTVSIQGSFSGWEPGQYITMTNIGGTVWESDSIILAANATHNYRYVVNDIVEFLPSEGSCTEADPSGQFDPTRFLTTGESDITLDIVCFESCLDCGDGIEGCTDSEASNYNPNAAVNFGCLYDVTFAVDMTGYDMSNVQIVNVNGNFNGWCGTCNQLYDEDGDNIYTTTIPVPSGPIEYLFTTNGWEGDQEVFDGTESCVLATPTEDDSTQFNVNRYFEVEQSTNILDPVCFSSCDVCVNQTVLVTFQVDMSNENVADVVSIIGSFNGYDINANPLTDMGNGIFQTTISLIANSQYMYSIANGGFAGLESVSGQACEAVSGYRDLIVGSDSILDPICFNSCDLCEDSQFYGCTDPSASNYDSSALVDDGSCFFAGCTDSNADNFNPNASEDDGSCTYCNLFQATLVFSGEPSGPGVCDGYMQVSGQGGSSNYSFVIYNQDGIPQNPFGLCYGTFNAVVTDNESSCTDELSLTFTEPVVGENPCDITPTGMFVDNIIHNRVVFNWSAPSAAPSHYMIRYRAVGTSSWTVMTAGPVNSNEFTGTSRTRYFMDAGTTYQWSMRARVLNEDGSMNCQSSWSANSEYTTLPECANLENLSVSTEANWVTLMADAPAVDWGVWQSKGKMREVGTNSYRYVNGDSQGAINFLKGNFDASTEYEWHTKAWCTGNVDANGDADPMYHSGWGDFSTFSTEDACDAVATNLTTSSNGANTAITMNWDTPESGAPDHYFLELTDETTGQVWAWNAIAGNSNSKTKYGLTTGNDFSWRIRGACGTNGTSWATSFTSPVYYTLGAERLAGPVANLDVYPNPSRDIFNVSFESAEAQTMTVRVVNMIGEEVYTEELTEFVGSYNKVIDMNTQSKGVYFLEVRSGNGTINKKIILQ